jgi:hypothetical protein
MMDEETVQQMRSRAWLEGLEAAFGTDSPENPYAPDYTPSLQEMNRVLRKTFTQEEIWRGEKQREGQLAEHERVMIVEELKTFEAEILEGEMMFRAGGGNLTKLDTVRECIALIKRKWN